MIKIGAPIHPVFGADHDIFDHVEAGGQGVLPEIDPGHMTGGIIWLRSVVGGACADVSQDPVIVASKVLPSTRKAKPVVELVLGVGTRPVPVGIDVGRPIGGHAAQISEHRVESEQQLVVGKFWRPVSPGVIKQHVGGDVAVVGPGRLARGCEAAVGGTRGGIVVVPCAVLEVVAPVRVSSWSRHIERSQQGDPVAGVGVESGVVVAVRTVDHPQFGVEGIVEPVGRKNARVIKGHDVEENAVGDIEVGRTFDHLISHCGDKFPDLEIPPVPHRSPDGGVGLFQKKGVGVVVGVVSGVGGAVHEIGGVLTDHYVGPKPCLGLVLGGHGLFQGQLEGIEIEVPPLGRVRRITSRHHGLVAGSGEIIAVTGIHITAQLHPLLGRFHKVVLHDFFRVRGGSGHIGICQSLGG